MDKALQVLKGLSAFWVVTGAVSVVLWVVLARLGRRELDPQETLGLVVVVASILYAAQWLWRARVSRKEGAHAATKPRQ